MVAEPDFDGHGGLLYRQTVVDGTPYSVLLVGYGIILSRGVIERLVRVDENAQTSRRCAQSVPIRYT